MIQKKKMLYLGNGKSFLYHFICILTDEGLRSERSSESNSVRNILRQCSINSLSITNAVMSLYNINDIFFVVIVVFVVVVVLFCFTMQ